MEDTDRQLGWKTQKQTYSRNGRHTHSQDGKHKHRHSGQKTQTQTDGQDRRRTQNVRIEDTDKKLGWKTQSWDWRHRLRQTVRKTDTVRRQTQTLRKEHRQRYTQAQRQSVRATNWPSLRSDSSDISDMSLLLSLWWRRRRRRKLRSLNERYLWKANTVMRIEGGNLQFISPQSTPQSINWKVQRTWIWYRLNWEVIEKQQVLSPLCPSVSNIFVSFLCCCNYCFLMCMYLSVMFASVHSNCPAHCACCIWCAAEMSSITVVIISILPVSYFVLWFSLIFAGVPCPSCLPCPSAVPYASCGPWTVTATSVVHVFPFSHTQWPSRWGVIQTVRGSVIMHVWNTAVMRMMMMLMMIMSLCSPARSGLQEFCNVAHCPLPIPYRAMVHPPLELGYIVWHPMFKGDKEMTEQVQRRATKLIPQRQAKVYPTALTHSVPWVPHPYGCAHATCGTRPLFCELHLSCLGKRPNWNRFKNKLNSKEGRELLHFLCTAWMFQLVKIWLLKEILVFWNFGYRLLMDDDSTNKADAWNDRWMLDSETDCMAALDQNSIYW